MKVFRGWLALVVGLLLLGAGAVGGLAVRGQLRRDEECRSNVQRAVHGIEAFRMQHGRLPRREELRGGGMAVIGYRVSFASHGELKAEQYELTLWRGERSIHYASTTGQNTCDSGAVQAALWIAGLLVLPGAVLLFAGVRGFRS